MQITASSAMWFLPFVLPVCLWVAWSDLRVMKIPNLAVLALAAIFLIVGLIALPFDQYIWRLVQLIIVLLVGIVMNAAGLIGAGDAKFAAAAAPFIALGDLRLLCVILAANLLAGFTAHRIAKYTSLRQLAPEWESWSRGKKFPMGLCLGGTLAIYLVLGALYGA
ncbi:prepilin peptidase [Roseovarius pelagicus]|uniref:Prepilin peptidase n=1 Tax=Roseovarius pelagicus TaxID=2980108 RepID=A0ABY6DGA0_9RHOB|nr:prepilin peptidase [Roseovarius pelagicus]UXX85184.1 prepilin peptidase [Roseovarius pelagicus]